MKFIKIAGLIGILAPIFALSGVFIATLLCDAGCGTGLGEQYSSAWNPDGSFSWKSNALSDLGVSTVAAIFNYPLIIGGLLNIVFYLGFISTYKGNKIILLGSLIAVLGTISLALVGIFTEAYGTLHLYVSMGFFIFFPIGLIIIGTGFYKDKLKKLGQISIISGIASLIVISGFINEWHLMFDLGFAVPEYIEALILSMWSIYNGNILYKK